MEFKVEIEKEPKSNFVAKCANSIWMVTWVFIQVTVWSMYTHYHNLHGKCGRPIGTWMLVQLIIWAVLTFIDLASSIAECFKGNLCCFCGTERA